MLLSLRQSHFSIPRLIFSKHPILPVSSLFYSGFSLILLDCFQSFKIPTHHPYSYLDLDAAIRFQPNDIQDDLGLFSSNPSRRLYIKTTDLPANDKILQPRPHQYKAALAKKSSVFHRNNTNKYLLWNEYVAFRLNCCNRMRNTFWIE